MARPAKSEVKLKDGFYIEVKQKGAQKGIKIRRESYDQIKSAIKKYEPTYAVSYIGEVANGKVK